MLLLPNRTMEVAISDRKLKRSIENDMERRKRFGADMAKKIRQRMGALAAADSLADFWPPYSGPERCHELKAGLAGTFSMDLKHPYRLLFEPLNLEADIATNDERKRWQSIISVNVIDIEDTHG